MPDWETFGFSGYVIFSEKPAFLIKSAILTNIADFIFQLWKFE